ncbi:MAG TPA: DUF2231 domain-containing protein [Gemmatimonadales bacterium]
MPNIAEFHPQIVHFVIALAFVGFALRLVSLTGRLSWTREAGAALLIMAALASVAAVESGDQAHGPAERVPGARDAVVEHEEYGEKTRTALLIIAALEVAGLALARKEQWQKAAHIASAVAFLYGGFLLYETGEHGGALVYSYAGGVGIRSGDSTDVRRLLVAGLYHQLQADRQAGDADGAARLADELQRRMPGDLTVTFIGIESQLKDRNDARGALDALSAVQVPADSPRFTLRKGLLTADAYSALGLKDSALAALEALRKDFAESPAVRDAIEKLK